MNPLHRLVLCWSTAACLLAPRVSAAGLPATVSLGDLVQSYDGTPKAPTVGTQPPGLNVSLRYIAPSSVVPLPTVETVFSNTPSPSSLSYSSHSFSSQQTCGLGDRVQLSGTAKDLTSVDVVLVTWAKAASYPAKAMENPVGWSHPVKMSIYDMDGAGTLTLKRELTNDIFIPWKPLTLNGQPYLYNGYAFVAHFDFPAGVVLPDKPVFMVSYNTGGSGFEPIGTLGPYNELNVAGATGAIIGTDENPSASLWVRSATSWIYPAVGTNPPMITVKASRIPEAGTTVPPVNAGTWQVVAKIDAVGYEGETSANFTVQPAVAEVVLGNLTQVANGSPKSASATTIPPGLAVDVTYNGAASPPTQQGKYAVHAAILNPNYLGTADGELWLGQNLASWLDPWIQNGSVSAAESGLHDDPDHDSIDNFLEYAMGLDPSSAMNPGVSGTGAPVAEFAGQALSLVYRKNLAATDLEYQVETTTQLGSTEVWEPAATLDSVVATEGSIQTIHATLAPQQNETRRFVRLSVVHH